MSGSWPDHLQSWLSPDATGARPIDDPRVLVLTFEEMKVNLASCVQRIAKHIECGLDEPAVAALLPKMDFKYMKVPNRRVSPTQPRRLSLCLTYRHYGCCRQENKDKFNPKSVAWRDKGDGWEFVNKGAVGASKAAFGPVQEQQFAAMMAQAFPAGVVDGLGIADRPDLVHTITGEGPAPAAAGAAAGAAGGLFACCFGDAAAETPTPAK